MTRTSRSLTRRAAPVGAVLATALTLAACSSDAEEAPSGDVTGDAQEAVTIEMSWWGDDARAALFDEVITAFEAEYPYITVTQTPVGSPDDLFNRLATDFGGGGDTAPDVFALGGAKPQEYGEAGALLDLGTVADIVNVAKYPEFSTTNAVVDGTLYGLPTGGNATAAFVNTDLFEAAGVPIPDADWTWDDLVDAANTIGTAGLTNESGAPVYGIDLRVQDIIGTYVAQVSEFGLYDWEGQLAVDADQVAGWYEIEQRMLEGGGLPDPTIVTAGWALPPDQQLFTLGQAGVTFGYSNLVGTYEMGGNTIILPPPSDTDKTGVALLPSAFWSINAATDHPEEAALLVDWFLNEPSAAELIQDTRGVPFNPDTAAVVSPLLEGASKTAAEYVESVLDSGEVAPPQPNGAANMNKYSQDAETAVLFGNANPQEAAQTFIDQLSGDLS
ncbi:extracellular solute-binding protein [Demequina sp. TTPB684]|uniref:ABC transporter substrate-binding protein n=1 Tax=unclassified Demequina TaxID=2620311 RepID=UPI001CF368C6|nr:MULTISPECIES: extracellular solute-binding protein [unclassified Demequina]MCB2411857.1 extracellular solute-binding protein [Demequina sp. TTPB684]UPU88612.1 extracellular solute-binding protein [Demequina sp. TMPB413]